MGGVQVGLGGGIGEFSQWEMLGKSSVQISSKRFLKTLTEGAVVGRIGITRVACKRFNVFLLTRPLLEP